MSDFPNRSKDRLVVLGWDGESWVREVEEEDLAVVQRDGEDWDLRVQRVEPQETEPRSGARAFAEDVECAFVSALPIRGERR